MMQRRIVRTIREEEPKNSESNASCLHQTTAPCSDFSTTYYFRSANVILHTLLSKTVAVTLIKIKQFKD